MILNALDFLVRALVVVALLYACAVALTHWAVRNRKLTPFGAWPRLVRRMSDPVLMAVERRVIQAGGSPQDAPLWMIGAVVVGGLLLLSLTRWLFGAIGQLDNLANAAPRDLLHLLVGVAFNLIMIALFIRVIGTWFGISRYRSWARPVYAVTDWIVEPIRRILPPVGMVDFSPMVAWLVLWVLRGFLLGII